MTTSSISRNFTKSLKDTTDCIQGAKKQMGILGDENRKARKQEILSGILKKMTEYKCPRNDDAM
jgi:hypothetical protein